MIGALNIAAAFATLIVGVVVRRGRVFRRSQSGSGVPSNAIVDDGTAGAPVIVDDGTAGTPIIVDA